MLHAKPRLPIEVRNADRNEFIGFSADNGRMPANAAMRLFTSIGTQHEHLVIAIPPTGPVGRIIDHSARDLQVGVCFAVLE